MKVPAFALAVLTLAVPAGVPTPYADPPAVVPNDNRAPAGRLHGDTLDLSLVLDLAIWRPEGPDGPAVVVPAFREVGKPPQVPAPLLRVRAGTVIRVRAENRLPSPYFLRGLFTRPGNLEDSIPLPARGSVTVTFAAGAPGTYVYGAWPPGYEPDKDAEAEQTFGALVVDPPGGSPPDRVFVINIWGEERDSLTYRNALAINGLSWPHTERIEATTGDTVYWRIVNASIRPHPMHMHGFYFTLLSRGEAHRDRRFGPDEERLAVTEHLFPFNTMAIRWVAERPGNWLFHCHLSFHVVPATRLDPPHDAHDRMSHEAGQHMAGLVLGFRVRAAPGYRDADRGTPPRHYLFAQEGARRGRSPRAMGYVLQRGATPPAPDSIEIPGSVLVLERGKPADVVVMNRIAEPVAIHWHGLELESWSDGVAGWSGADSVVAPAIAPGDSFVARLTVPRSGTFIYHTHMNDIEQVTAGLYGALVVVEPGTRLDPETDHVFVIGWDGDVPGGPPHILVNGDSAPAPLVLRSGASHRFRFVNIGPATVQTIELRRDTLHVPWRRLALDGADLPAPQRVVTPARHRLSVGQTADFEATLEPGRYRLTYTLPLGKVAVAQDLVVGETAGSRE